MVAADGQGRWLILMQNPVTPGTYSYSSTLIRLAADGTIDGSFGTDGSITLPNDPRGLAIDSKGRPVILAIRTDPAAIGTLGVATATIVTRLTRDGTLDALFGEGGTAVVDIPLPIIARAIGSPSTPGDSWTLANAITTTASDQIVVAGSVINIRVAIAGYVQRLSPTGTPDTTFGEGDGVTTYGRRRLSTDEVAHGSRVTTTRGGRLYVVGHLSKDIRQMTWKRTPNGAPDPAFGNGGWRWSTASGRLIQSAATCDGGLIQTATQRIMLFRPDGSPDPRYGRNGVINVSPRSPLGRMDFAAVDARACPTNYVAASTTTQGARRGITLVWLSLFPR